ncbi:MAG: hypothetical protein ACHQX4_03470 [Gemmatimonadales bacterium]
MSVPVAVQFVQPPDSMHVGDTVVLHVRVLNRAGDSIPGAPIVLFSQDPDTMSVDSALFAVVANIVGTGRVVARSGTLPSDPLPILIH